MPAEREYDYVKTKTKIINLISESKPSQPVYKFFTNIQSP